MTKEDLSQAPTMAPDELLAIVKQWRANTEPFAWMDGESAAKAQARLTLAPELVAILDAADLLCRLERLATRRNVLVRDEIREAIEDALEYVRREHARERGGSDGG